jgi:hypothetical protein
MKKTLNLIIIQLGKIHKMAKKYTTKGQAWDGIHVALGTLVRRQATEQRPLTEIQQVYDLINLCKRYESEGSSKTIANKLEEKAKNKKVKE